jgi:uracil-DNA glycosylase
MTGRQSALRRFLAHLTATCPPQTFNPWVQVDAGTDRAGDAAAARLARLRAHLDCDARLLLIGEAAGYQGCHVSGIAFTSERLILEGRIPRVSVAERLTTRARPWSEPSATTVWGALHELGLAETTVLWNCFPWHPHRAGEPQSNRTPTRAECALGRPVLEALCEAFPAARVVAVGRAAQGALAAVGREAPGLRHPSMGGAMAFRAGLAEWAGRGARQKRL